MTVTHTITFTYLDHFDVLYGLSSAPRLSAAKNPLGFMPLNMMMCGHAYIPMVFGTEWEGREKAFQQ